MSFDQIITLAVLAGVFVAFVMDKARADLVALTGAAILLALGVVSPSEVQRAFASPAIIALASLFVLNRALERSGVLRLVLVTAAKQARRFGVLALGGVFALVAGVSGFMNNTPVVLLAAPIVRDMAVRLKIHPRRVLIPLSYMVVMIGTCTLIGTSTNLLVDDMAAASGLRRFGMFEMTPVGLSLTVAGLLYLGLIGWRLLPGERPDDAAHEPEPKARRAARPRLRPWAAVLSVGMFVLVVTLAALDVGHIAALAFAGAVALVLMRVLSLDEAYGGLQPDLLLLIAGMLVLGIAIETTGLAEDAMRGLTVWLTPFHPMVALAVLYLVTLILTEIMSNAGVAVLVTPLAVALAQALYVDPRPFVIAVMMAGSAAFATPVGYQTNTIVYGMGRYRYVDFIKVGLPLNLVTWAAAMWAIPRFFPFAG